MTRDVITATPDTPLDQIATMLERYCIKRVPIVGAGKIVGIVSRANLVQALASLTEKRISPTAVSDAALRGKLLGRLQKAPRTGTLPNVIVRDGAVQLWGMVDSEAERNVVRVAIETTPGVCGVVDNLIVRAGVSDSR